jgi:hypothetical protein
MLKAMGKSNREPSLGISAGAKLIVMRLAGKSNWQFLMALRTRSLLSLTAASGRPTIEKLGKPLDKWASTVTDGAVIPELLREWMVASDMESFPSLSLKLLALA